MKENALYELSVICGMNQRYHQIEMSWWSTAATLIAVAVAFVALASAILTVASFFRGNRVLARFSLAVSILSLVAATALNILPADSNAKFYADMFRRWSDLRQDVDLLEADAGSLKKDAKPDEILSNRYRELLAKEKSLNALEPAPNKELLLRCLDDEEQSRGLPPYRSAQVKKLAVN